MSDYLWDKSGEPDREIEQLEEMLGRFRYRPQKLQLPVEAPALRPRRNYRPAFAVAASLLLMALVGLWVGLGHHRGGNNPLQVADRSHQMTPEKTLPQVVETPAETAAPVIARNSEADQRTSGSRSEAILRHQKIYRASVEKQRGRPNPGNEPENTGPNRQTAPIMIAARATDRGIEARAALNEQQMAKNQLMLALRLASAKLNIVQRKTQGTSVKPAPHEPNRES